MGCITHAALSVHIEPNIVVLKHHLQPLRAITDKRAESNYVVMLKAELVIDRMIIDTD